jgi:hypothetical protein
MKNLLLTILLSLLLTQVSAKTQTVQAYPNYPANCEIKMESTTYWLTVINNSNISDIKVFINIDDRKDVFIDSTMRKEVDHIRIRPNSSYTINIAVDYIIVGSCTGEIVDVTLTTDLYAINTITKRDVNVTTDLGFNTGIWAKRNAKTVYYILSTDPVGFIRISNDDMATDINTYTFPAVVDFVHITVRESILVWSDSKVYRSTDDGKTFVIVQTDVIHPYNHNAVGSSVNEVYWAEYGVNEYPNKRVFYSDNDGENWSTILSVPYGLETIRHFHTCKKNPYDGRLYITSGDNDAQCRMWRSAVGDFTTIYEIELPDSQIWRTVTMLFNADGTVTWASDSQSYSITGVFRANITDLGPDINIQTEVTELFKTSGTIYTLEYIDNYLFCATYYDSDVSSNGDGEPSVFVSTDNGASWNKIAVWELQDIEDASGGFRNCLMDYSNSRAYIRGHGDLKKHAEFWGNPYDLIIYF